MTHYFTRASIRLRKSTLFFILLCITCLNAQQKTEKSAKQETARGLVEDFIFNMKSADSLTFAGMVTPNFKWSTLKENEKGSAYIVESDLPELLKRFSEVNKNYPHWKEVVYNFNTNSNGKIATVWLDYLLFSDFKKKTAAYCGQHNFQLVKQGNSWFIMSILDARSICKQNFLPEETILPNPNGVPFPPATGSNSK